MAPRSLGAAGFVSSLTIREAATATGRRSPPTLRGMCAARLPSSDLGLTWKPISEDDIDSLLALVGVLEAHDNWAERQDRDDLVEALFEGSYKDATRDSVLGVDDVGVARAFGHLTPLPGETLRRVYLSGGVHPDWRRRGIGREVLRWQTERAHESIAEQEAAAEREGDVGSASQPWRIVAHQEAGQADTGALYNAAGYTAIRWSHDMVRPLAAGAPAIPDVAAPEGLELASWTEEFDEAVRLAHNEAFAQHWGSQPRDDEMWAGSVTKHRCFRRDWSRIVLDPTQPESDGRPAVAGYIACYAYPQDWEAAGHTQGWVQLIGVRPAWRRRKLAPALLAAAMRAFVAAGMDAAALDVDAGNATGALDLYEGMGFRVRSTHVAWAIEGPGAAGL